MEQSKKALESSGSKNIGEGVAVHGDHVVFTFSVSEQIASKFVKKLWLNAKNNRPTSDLTHSRFMIKKYGETRDVISQVKYLVSGDSSFVTDSIIKINGRINA